MSSGALAAKVGSRLAHAAMPMVLPSSAMVASALGAHVVGPAGMGGAGAAAAGAGIGNAGGSVISLMDMIPIVTTGAITTGAFDVMLGPGQMAVFAPSLPQPCAPHLAQPIAMGSPTVLVHGMQLVRVGDKTTCGALVCDGVKTVVIGGGATAAPSVSIGDMAGSLGSVAMGALLGQTGAVEMVNEFGAALAKTSDDVVETVTGAVEQAASAAGAVVGKFGEMVGSVGGALESILGGAGLTGQTK